MNDSNNTPSNDVKPQAAEPVGTLLDFDSDEPLVACPLRNNGSDFCEACQ